MKNTIKFLLISVSVSLLTACAGMGWNKPGATEAMFYSDKIDCERQASSTYPVVMGSSGVGYQAPTQTNCSRIGSNVNCTTYPGAFTPPPQQDMNATARIIHTSSCLKAKGYTWSMGN
jgi:hypothetical protein